MAPRRSVLLDRYDVLVLGAGMSGLAAGIRLAQAGRQVALLERHSLWGGLNSFYKLRGRRHDVGLHALTNYARPGERGKPLLRALRQLRIPWAELRLGEQKGSCVLFPEVRLRFENGIELLRSEIARAFPAERAGFDRLLADIATYPEPDVEDGRTARAELPRYFGDPLLIEMLLTPICWYGSPLEDDVAWTGFVVLFKSLFEEGFARPEGGVRRLLELLLARYEEEGGELHLRSGVQRVLHEGRRAVGVVLDDGREVRAPRILSSIGWDETLALVEDGSGACAEAGTRRDARLSFVESITVLDRPLAALGHETTIAFFNRAPRFSWRRPDGLVDYQSGVVCAPDNYHAPGAAPEGLLRLTLLANHARWTNLAPEAYGAEKERVWHESCARLADFLLDARPHAVDHDLFTPRTIERFTGHLGGAVYGAPRKHGSGLTPIANLYVCGTDQGMLGIVGAMLSGVAMANRHVLLEAATA